jgi:hypothetical protein
VVRYRYFHIEENSLLEVPHRQSPQEVLVGENSLVKNFTPRPTPLLVPLSPAIHEFPRTIEQHIIASLNLISDDLSPLLELPQPLRFFFAMKFDVDQMGPFRDHF